MFRFLKYLVAQVKPEEAEKKILTFLFSDIPNKLYIKFIFKNKKYF